MKIELQYFIFFNSIIVLVLCEIKMYEMKNLILIICVFAFSLNNVNSKEVVNNPLFSVVKFNSNGWQLLKTENGINVYVSNYEWVDGALKLKVKFENTTGSDVNLSFEISSNSPDFSVRDYTLTVKANSSVEFLDENSPISINVGQTEKDFLINFK